MDHTETQRLIVQLAAGFETLENEYQKLFRQQQAVERKLATAREQYNELAKLYGSGDQSTPPLSLSSTLATPKDTLVTTASDILERSPDTQSKEAARRVREGLSAARSLKRGLGQQVQVEGEGVRIWSGPAADRPDASSSMMPSISESPLEQDFTIEGKPSQLGCPFASMANKKLSSHAASVLSRYNKDGPTVGSASQSSVSRVNGRESFSQRQSRRASIVDPIKAEICGLSDHAGDPKQFVGEASIQEHTDANPDVGVCPIRFLNQHSPEEVATYFEKHKHELPRSHEVCVRRYQSNEQQIKQLDAKYGNLVSMIQGLGEKHKDYLPEDPDPEDDDAASVENESNEKIQQWASSVSAQAPIDPAAVEEDDDGRQPHFERDLRDIRVGESPSRPWGISVPPKYLERSPRSNASSNPAEPTAQPVPQTHGKVVGSAPARCPFGFDKVEAKEDTRPSGDDALRATDSIARMQAPPEQSNPQPPVFIAPSRPTPKLEQPAEQPPGHGSMTFHNCPVFIGYSVEEATRILRESGYSNAK